MKNCFHSWETSLKGLRCFLCQGAAAVLTGHASGKGGIAGGGIICTARPPVLYYVAVPYAGAPAVIFLLRLIMTAAVPISSAAGRAQSPVISHGDMPPLPVSGLATFAVSFCEQDTSAISAAFPVLSASAVPAVLFHLSADFFCRSGSSISCLYWDCPCPIRLWNCPEWQTGKGCLLLP